MLMVFGYSTFFKLSILKNKEIRSQCFWIKFNCLQKKMTVRKKIYLVIELIGIDSFPKKMLLWTEKM